MNLLCLPCAGASATMYLRWKTLIPQHINITLIEPAGRGYRISDDFICTFEQQVDDLFTKYFVDGAHIAQDYIIFGHSMGALLAYGLVHKLRVENMKLPKAMIVSASAAPSARDDERFEKLDDESLIADLKSHNGTPKALFEHPELLAMTIECLRSDYQACYNFEYQKKEALPIPIHVFRGVDDEIELSALAAWQQETTHPISMDTFEGGHFYLKPTQSESAMIKKLLQILSSYEGRYV